MILGRFNQCAGDNKMRIYAVVLISVLILPVNVYADDYPTMDSVRYVLDCMAELGAQTEENLYTCVCRHDVITEAMPFKEYEQATFFERYNDMPGKRGGLVRDSKDGEKLRDSLVEVKKEAGVKCIVVKHIERQPVKTQE
jgi:hypothetical protein